MIMKNYNINNNGNNDNKTTTLTIITTTSMSICFSEIPGPPKPSTGFAGGEKPDLADGRGW
jgi:hypothetical protein